MSLTNALGIAASALSATQRQLTQTSQNIAAADIPGTTRKRVPVSTAVAGGSGIGLAIGVTIRAEDPALRRLLLQTSAEGSAASLRQAILQNVDLVAGQPHEGVGTAGLVRRLEDAFTTLRADPSAAIEQIKTLEAARDLTQHLNRLSGAVQKARQEAHDTLVATVNRGNEVLGELGRLNRRIVELGFARQPTAELEDTRDRLVLELSETFGFRPIQQASGAIAIVTRNGLVLPQRADALSIDETTIDATSFYEPGNLLSSIPRLTVNLDGGQSFELASVHLAGRAGEAMALRDGTLPLMQAELDEFAQKLARRFDQQGLRLFSRPNGTIPVENATDQQGYVGFAREITVYPAILTDPRYLRDGTHAIPGGTPPAFPGGTPNASPAPSGSAFTPNPPGGPAAFDTLIRRVLDHALGATRDTGPPPLAHDPLFRTTNLGPYTNPLFQLTSPLSVTARTTLFEYATLATARHASVVSSAAAAKEAGEAARSLAEQKLADRVGISVDREMALLVELQNAYVANARVMTTVQAMWDSLFSAVR